MARALLPDPAPVVGRLMVMQTSRELMAEGRRDDLRIILEYVSRSLVVDERAFTKDLGGGESWEALQLLLDFEGGEGQGGIQQLVD